MKSNFIFNLFSKLFYAKPQSNVLSTKYYLEKLESGELSRKVFMGIADFSADFLTADPISTPGLLCIGGQGSGKSKGLKAAAVTALAASPETSAFFLVDPLKGMGDYTTMFPYEKNVCVSIGKDNDEAMLKFSILIDMLYEEMTARQKAFIEKEASDLHDYEKKTGEKVANLFIVCEEFHAITLHPKVNFFENANEDGTVANKMKKLARAGRSYGICIMAATQRATQTDFPSDLRAGITNILAFQVKTSADAAMVNLGHAADIKSTQRGRAAHEEGFIQMPLFTDEFCTKLLKKYYKPLSAKLFLHKMEDYRLALGDEGVKGAVKNQALLKVVKNIESYQLEDVSERILKLFDFTLEEQSNKALHFQQYALKNGKKYAVWSIDAFKNASSSRGMSRGRSNMDDREIDRVKKELKSKGCDGLIVITNSSSKTGLSGENIIDLDKFDMVNIAEILENEESLKEEGLWDEKYNSIPLVNLESGVSEESQSRPQRKSLFKM